MCALARVAVLFLLVIFFGYLAYPKRYQLAAEFWHWRHGYSATMGNYEVPVPKHWLITERTSNYFTLMNSAPTAPRDAKFHTTPVVTVSPFPSQRTTGAGSLALWLSLHREHLARLEVASVEEKTMIFGDESMVCIGGPILDAMIRGNPKHLETDVVSLSCRSESGLEIVFLGEPSDVQSFYTFVSHIKRKT